MIACRSLVMRFAAACALSMGIAASANAATLFVTTPLDVIANGDGCSLREALINANTNSRAGSIECVAGEPGAVRADVIVLPPATVDVRAMTEDEDDPAVGDLDVSDDLLVWGGGALSTRLDGQYATRLFDVHAGVLALRGLALWRGEAKEQGGAVRVGAGATLKLEDVTVDESRVTSFAVGGQGGGIYVGAGGRAVIDRSAILGNGVNGVGGEGAGIYCAANCTLSMHSTTVAANTATTAGAGIFVAGGGDASLSFVTLGYNRAISGSAIHAAGDVDLFAVISAENGNGMAGDDLECAGGLVTAAYAFAENPGSCAVVTGLTSRASLIASDARYAETQYNVSLTDIGQQRFDGQPSSLLYWNSQFRPVFKAVVPATDPQCVGHRDQFGRIPVTGANCDLGAGVDFVMAANPMTLSMRAGGSDGALVVGTFITPTIDTVIRFEATGGIGEGCELPSRDFLFPAGTYNTQVTLDPDVFFARPAVGRPVRVCEMQARAVSGDPAIVGSTTGTLRAVVDTGSSGLDGALSSPRPGTFLLMGVVPVGAGGASNIVFRPPQAGWRVVSASIDASSPDPDRFALPALLPLALDVSGTNFPVTCVGGVLGEFEAFLNVTLDTGGGENLELVYGLRCRAAHTLAMSLESSYVEEGETALLSLTLDSPSLLPGPLSIDLLNAGGDAIEGVDYQPFTGAGVVTFQPGDRTRAVAIRTTDDEIVGPDEYLQVVLQLPVAEPDIVVLGGGAAELKILNNDHAVTGIELAPLSGVPARSPAGVRNPVNTVLRNISNAASGALGSVRLDITVDKPVWVYSFVARKCASAAIPCDQSTPLDGWIYADCSVAPSQRLATCNFPHTFGPGEELEVSAIVEMAEINEAPTLDVHGIMRVTASAMIGGETIEQYVESPYIITGRQSGGGGGFGPWSLLVASALVLRGLRKRTGGGKVRPGVVRGCNLPAGVGANASHGPK